MAVTEEDIDKLIERIVGSSQEEFIAAVTGTLIDDLMAGTRNASANNTIGYLAAANREQLDALLMRYRPRIEADVMASVESFLSSVDGRDAEALGLDTLARHFDMIKDQTAVGIREIIDRQNIALVDQAASTWYRVTAKTLHASNSGVDLAGGTIERAVLELTKAGIATIDYKSGISNQVDVAVKRHIRTQANQAAARMTMDRLRESGHDLVQTTAHFGAREDHAVWQGKAFSLSGPQTIDGVLYPDFYDATGYGTVTGLCGANCRHHFDIHVPGVSTLHELPEEIDGMTSDEYYRATQRQRELERRIRKTKRDIAGLEQAGLGLESPTYVQKRLVLGKQQNAIAAHVRDNNLIREYAREKAYGIGSQPRALRSTVWAVRPDQKIARAKHAVVIQGSEPSRFVDRSLIDVKKNFAGYQSATGKELRVRGRLAEEYGGDPDRWMHLAGEGWIFDPADGKIRRAEIHWMEEESVGPVEFWFKRWRDR